MGLDWLEFIAAVEEAFDLRFSDLHLHTLTTPGRLINKLTCVPAGNNHINLPVSASLLPPAARVSDRVGCPQSAVRPDTSLLDLIPVGERRAFWRGPTCNRIAKPQGAAPTGRRRLAGVAISTDAHSQHPGCGRCSGCLSSVDGEGWGRGLDTRRGGSGCAGVDS